MATNEFLVFDESQTNTLTQEEYASDSQRIGGVSSGMARSDLHNKVLHQVSMMAAALAQVIADTGRDVSDQDLVLLTEQLKSVLGGEEVYIISDDGTRKYRLGIDDVAMYYEEADEGGDEDVEEAAVVLTLNDAANTGYFVEYDGVTKPIEIAVDSEEELTDGMYNFEII